MNYTAVVRVVYGLSLLLAPGAVIRGLAREPADSASKIVGRILGLRHLVQALTLERADTRGRLLPVSAAIDGAHALSMLGVVALDRDHRRQAGLDAALAAILTLNELREARNV